MSLAAKIKEKKHHSYLETRKKPERSFFSSALSLVFVSFLVSVLLSLALSVCLRASMTSHSFACSELQGKIKAQVVEGEKLRKKAALLASPRRVEKIALTRIKMVKPDKVYFLQLDAQSSLSYSFKKPPLKLKPAGWLDDFIDRVVFLKTDRGLAYRSR